jgi:hypothetical protein
LIVAYFCRIAEFVIETNTFSGDGTKVREMSSTKDISAVEGKSLFINICSSDLIEPPKDKDGKPINNSRTMADGLEIPLVIGPVRPLSEKANAVDVIFNPVVSKTCKEERYFRGQVLELVRTWFCLFSRNNVGGMIFAWYLTNKPR